MEGKDYSSNLFDDDTRDFFNEESDINDVQASVAIDDKRSVLSATKQKSANHLIDDIAHQLLNIPLLIDTLHTSSEIALDISKEMAQKIANNEIRFGQFKENGRQYAQFINTATHRISQNIPIKTLPTNFGTLIAQAALTQQIAQLDHKLDQLADKIDEVNRNFTINRFALTNTAREDLELALSMHDKSAKHILLLTALNSATTAKNEMLLKLLELKQSLSNTKMAPKRATQAASRALDYLQKTREAFQIQTSVLFELGEYSALAKALNSFRSTIVNEFSGDDALRLDGNLKGTELPFTILSTQIKDTTESVLLAIKNNRTALVDGQNYSNILINKGDQ
jgi:hypothetical protein